MSKREIPDGAIEQVAKHINERNNKSYHIPVIGNTDNLETPQVFEILSFDEIDKSTKHFYAIDGSYNSEQFYNGLSIGVYTAGYVCYQGGKQVRMNTLDDPIILGQAYYPENILITNEAHLSAIYDELLTLEPVKNLFYFWSKQGLATNLSDVFPIEKDKICANLSTLLGFCQEILEISLILEVSQRAETRRGDFILRDGTLRPLQIKQQYLIAIGEYLHKQGISIIAVTKQSPIKMELAYTFKQIDNYLQDQLKPQYPFIQKDSRRQKLCCWFEVPDAVLIGAYNKSAMFIKKDFKGGRGFGLFFAARLDYVEKLQNYDWLIIDLNIFDCIPSIKQGGKERNRDVLGEIFSELTRLTQEHYILGYPYPLAEAHNFVTLKSTFKNELVARVKYTLYKDQRMDHVDIENLFLDIHDRF